MAAKMSDIGGVANAVNALTVTDNGEKAYLLDPRVDAVISVSLSDATRYIYKWYDKEYHHRRWMCYCLFSVRKDFGDYLPMLFFNQTRKTFHLIVFQIDHTRRLLHKFSEHLLNVDGVHNTKLCYAAHKDRDHIQIIFYGRWGNEEERQVYVLVSFDCRPMRISTQTGQLPIGQWELPFIADQALNFVSSEKQPTLICTRPLDDAQSWTVRTVAADKHHGNPEKMGVWCNAWRNDDGWFVVTTKREDDQRNTSLWLLDVGQCTWMKLPIDLQTPEKAANFAFRVCPNGSAFIHADWDRTSACFHRFQLKAYTRMATCRASQNGETSTGSTDKDDLANDELLQTDEIEETDGMLATATTSDLASEVLCPICLDTYTDPRTLSCGHSLCAHCIAQMRLNAKTPRIQCPTCRRNTTVPAHGLPRNFSLVDAIEKLETSRNSIENSRRCDACRRKWEETELWKCMQCLLSDENGHHQLCPSCVLQSHSDHDRLTLLDFEKQQALGQDLIDRAVTDTADVLEHTRLTLIKEIDSKLIQPLKDICDLKYSGINAAADHATIEDQTTAISEHLKRVCLEASISPSAAFQANIEEFVTDSIINSNENEDAHCSRIEI